MHYLYHVQNIIKIASVSLSFNQQKVLNYQKFCFEVEYLKNSHYLRVARVQWFCGFARFDVRV